MKNSYSFLRLALRRTKSFLTFSRLLPVMMLALLLTGSGEKAWGQAILPISNVATTSGSNTMPTGFTQSGVGTYSSTATPWKFDDTGDWVICNFNAAPGTLTFKLTNYSLSGTYAFNVLQSADGTNYTNLLSITSVTSTQTFTISTISSTTRYIKWIYTTKSAGNIGLGTIGLTEVAGTPDIALDNNGPQVAAADVSQGTAAVVLHKFQLGVSSASALLTGMTCTTTGTYAAADITNLKVRYSADATLDGADATLSTFTNPGAAGSKTFPSFTNRSIAKDATGYFFITADVAANATHNNTIGIEAITTDNLTFSSGNKSGSTNAGGLQTFKDVTAPTVSSFNPTDGNTSVTANQNLVITFNENVIAGTEGTFDIYNSSGLLESIPYNDGRITFLNNTVTINPNATFALGANYYVNISANAITDNAGNAYAGISNNTTWNFTTTKPTVSVVSSTNDNGTYKVGDVITVTVTFNETVFVTNNPRVTLSLGTNRFANYSTGSGTNTLSFNYTLQSGDVSSDLNYVTTTSLGLNGDGTIRTADGIDATLTLPATSNEFSLAGQKAIVVDCVGPTVSSYSPTDGNMTVTVNQNLIITFNENIKVGTSGSVDIYNTEGLFESIPYNDERLTISTNTLTINPTGTFAYSSDYYVQIGANVISDLYDNNYIGISNTTTWNFTTECGPVSLPYNESFTNYLPNTCWSEKTGLLAATSTLTGTSSAWVADGFANNGTTGSARLNIYGTTAKEWLITPTIDLGTTTDYQLEFDLALTTYNATTNPATTGTDDKFAVVISTDNGATWTSANTLRIWDNSGSTDVYNNLTPAGTHVTISLADYTGWVKIGFYGESTVSNAGNDLFIDNLSVVQLATCITPTVVTSSDVTAISATISWVASSSNPANGYQYELRTSGAAGSGATGLVTSGITAAGVVSKAITGLIPNTSYNIFVRSDCGAGDFSAWTSVYSFSTPNLAAPTATAATAISTTGFTANWGAVSGANGYKLDVATSLGGVLLTQDFENATFPPTGWLATGFTRSISANDVKNGIAAASSGSSNTGTLTTSSVAYPTTLRFYLGRSNSNTTAKSLKINVSTTNQSSGFSTIATYDHSNVPASSYDQYTIDLSAYSSYSTVYIQFERVSTSNSPWRLDDIEIEKQSSYASGFNDLSVSGTSQIVTGLNPNSTYYYRVRATSANSTSANSNTVTAFTAIDGTVNASTLADCATCNVTVADGGHLTVDAVKTFNAVTVQPTAKLTVSDGVTLTAPVTIKSTSEGTATAIGAVTGSSNVEQYLSDDSRSWWYLSSPVTGATSALFGSDKVGQYNEATTSYSSPFSTATELIAGTGYVVKRAVTTAGTYTFAGTLNNGDITLHPTRTGTTAGKRGFNLVGNPYPSYLDWDAAYADAATSNIRNAIWYRTYSGSQMTFHTYADEDGVPATVSGIIPPAQAFWIRVNADGSNGTITFKNAHRSHAGATANPLKAPKANDRPRVRLQISNGVNGDEALIVAKSYASNGIDSYDIEKMSNDNVDVPEIYTLLNNQDMVINSFNSFVAGQEIALGMRPGKAGDFTINATQFENIPSDIKVILKDKLTGAETELSENASYSFNADGTETNQRFSLLFRAPGSVTGIDNAGNNTLLVYAQQSEIVVNSEELKGSNITVYTATGQSVLKTVAAANREVLNGNFTPGVYFVKVNNTVKKVSVK